MDKYNKLWNDVKLKLKELLNEDAYLNIASRTSEDIYKFFNNHIYILVDANFVKDTINRLHLNKINTIATELFGEPISFKFVTADDVETIFPIKKNVSDVKKTNLINSNLNPNFTFENFVVGKSNNYPFKVSMKVADQPGIVHNPLYIFGGVGLGKTHLMQAIGNYILDKDINQKLIYAKADQFIEDYKYYLDTKDMLGFYEKYRDVDILLIDDIQMLSRANQSQSEFFKIFDKLKNNNKQIVITSDCPPQDLKDIMERLTSRFQESLVINITVPDLSHRKDILKQELTHSYDLNDLNDIPQNCLDYIADNFVTNIRELKGALKSAITYCEINEVAYNLSNFKKSLELLISSKQKTNQLAENNLDKVQSVVSEFYNISVSDLIGPKKVKKYAFPRQVAMYLIRSLYDTPLTKIGEIFGNRHHTTVLSAYNEIDRGIKRDPLIERAVTTLIKKIGG